MDSLYSILKFYRILLKVFIQFMNIYPEQLHVRNVFKNSLFLYARLHVCVTKTVLSLQLVMNGTFL